MKKSLQEKLTVLVEQHEETGHLLSDPGVIADQNRFRTLSKEYAEIEPLVRAFHQYQSALQTEQSAMQLLQLEKDPEMRNMAEDEIATAKQQQRDLTQTLEHLLLPKDLNSAQS